MKQTGTKTTGSFDRYQPYSKQKSSGTSISKQYTKPVEQVTKRQIQTPANLNRSRTSVQGTTKQEPRKNYTVTRGSSSVPQVRQGGTNTRVIQKQSPVVHSSAPSRSKEAQRTVVSRQKTGSQSKQYSQGDYERAKTSNGRPSGSVSRQQAKAGFSGAPVGGPSSQGYFGSPAMNSRR